jgi:hypothetical protein
MSFDEGYQAGTQGMAKAIDTAHLIATIQERKRIIKLLTDSDNKLYFEWLRGPAEKTFHEYMEIEKGLRLAINIIEETK